MSNMIEKVEYFLEVLQREKIRDIYIALAEYIGADPRRVSMYLKSRYHQTSWVVKKTTGIPSGVKFHRMLSQLTSILACHITLIWEKNYQ